MRGSGSAARVAFAIAVLVQLAVLYWPRAPQPPDDLPVDKLVHAAVFAAVLVTGVRARVPVVPLGVVLCGHAVLSEVLQATVLPHRSGDPWDVLADVTGVLLAVAFVTSGRGPGSAAGRAAQRLADPADGGPAARR